MFKTMNSIVHLLRIELNWTGTVLFNCSWVDIYFLIMIDSQLQELNKFNKDS